MNRIHQDRQNEGPKDDTTENLDDCEVLSTVSAIGRYKRFPTEVLPKVVGDYVQAASHAIGCDPAFIALPLLGCLARAIGNRRAIALKRTWKEPAIVWAAVIGKSGTHKTPALNAAGVFLDRIQDRAFKNFQGALEQFETDKALYDRNYAAWKKSKSTEPPPYPPQEPVAARYKTTDCTIEALASLLHSQSDGVLVVRDELAGWLGGIAEYKGGKGSDLGHWLSMWGASSLTVDRKTSTTKTLHIPRASCSIVGGIQPEVLKRAIGREHMQDGLCARLLLAMPEVKPVVWSEAVVDQSTEDSLSELVDKLLNIEGDQDDEGNPQPLIMPLAPGAKHLWVQYFNRHRSELSRLDSDLAACWSKLEAYTARFALIFQLCSWASNEPYAADTEIDEQSMQAAISLSDWFGDEAKRVYALFGETNHESDTRGLVDLVRSHGGVTTVRDVMRSSRRWATAHEAEIDLNTLVRSGLCRTEVQQHPKGGKPTVVYKLTMPLTVDNTQQTSGVNGYCHSMAVKNGVKHEGFEDINRRFAECSEFPEFAQ